MLIPAGFAQANFKFGGASAPTGAECTIGFDVTGNTDSVQDQAEALFGFWADNIMGQLTSGLQLQSVLLKHGPNATGVAAEFFGGVNGSNETQNDSPQVAVLINKQTELGGRKGRGRLFLPGVPSSEIDNSGQVAGINVTAITSAFASFKNDCVADSLEPVLLHNSVLTPTPITDFVAITKVGTQRRRLRR